MAEEVALEKAIPITVSRFELAEQSRNIFSVTVPVDVKREQVIDEAFWQHVSKSLAPGNRIEVMPDDMGWYMELMVLGSGNLYAHVAELRYVDLTGFTAPVDMPSAYKVEWAGPHAKWRVRRGEDVMEKQFQTKKEAQQWAENHIAAVNR